MTEQHAPAQVLREAHVSSPLIQHYIDGSTSRDTLLLLPMLVAERDDTSPVCLHQIHLPDGKLSYCNIETTQTCFGCSRPICEAHQARNLVAIPDKYGVFAKEHTAPLCETCAALPQVVVYALHDFLIAINELHNQDERSAPIEVKWNIPSWMLTKPVAPHMHKSPKELD